MRRRLSVEARRELIEAVGERYRAAGRIEKKQILDEFAEIAGYHRKYAIRVLRSGRRSTEPTRSQRRRIYNEAVVTALTIVWEAADRICGKRLKAVLPTFVESMEHHGHLCLDPEVRQRLLEMSAATIDRLLRPVREVAKQRRRRAFLTTPLRKSISIRTFNDWKNPPPGYFEMDMVAHCGNSVAGHHVHSLVLTDIASGWTEAAALIVREQTLITVTLDEIQSRLPFPMLGLDVDNDSAFINETVLGYCKNRELELTRSRAYKKNDQAWIEQKNGAVVRKLVGYGRLEGADATVVLAELHKVARLYVNFFQPSFKLKSKKREGAKVIKKYHPPATPCEQLLAEDRVGALVKDQLRKQFAALDPVQLLNQIRQAQRNIASLEAGASSEQQKEQSVQLNQFVQSLATAWRHGEVRAPYRKRRPDAKPHTWRTRADPFEDVWSMVQQWLNDEPNTTAKDLFLRLNMQIPDRFKPSQLRTLQRRVKEWRTSIARRLVLGCNDDANAQRILSGIHAESASKDVVNS
jgi:hypothetical protein